MATSRLIVEAMLKDATEAITKNCPMVAQVTRDGQGIILELDDPPHTQITLELKRGA